MRQSRSAFLVSSPDLPSAGSCRVYAHSKESAARKALRWPVFRDCERFDVMAESHTLAGPSRFRRSTLARQADALSGV